MTQIARQSAQFVSVLFGKFSSLSAQYNHGEYPVTQMVHNSIVRLNSHRACAQQGLNVLQDLISPSQMHRHNGISVGDPATNDTSRSAVE